MDVESTCTDIEVDITIDFDDLEALIRDGALLAYPENGPALGFVYDQHRLATSLIPEYENADGEVPLAVSEQVLIKLLNGYEVEWSHWHPEDVDVTLRYEDDPENGDGPQLGPEDLER